MKDRMVLTFAPETVSDIEALAVKKGTTKVEIVRTAISVYMALMDCFDEKKNQLAVIDQKDKIIARFLLTKKS